MLQRLALVVDYICTAALLLMTALLVLGYALSGDGATLAMALVVIDGPILLAVIGAKAFRFVVGYHPVPYSYL